MGHYASEMPDYDSDQPKPAIDAMARYVTGATRSNDADKIDPEGFLSPLVVRRYAEYLHKHRIQADGKPRESDNWQQGMPIPRYMKSAWRHFLTWWTLHRGWPVPDADIEDAICAVIFNAQGYLHERLKAKIADGAESSYLTRADRRGNIDAARAISDAAVAERERAGR